MTRYISIKWFLIGIAITCLIAATPGIFNAVSITWGDGSVQTRAPANVNLIVNPGMNIWQRGTIQTNFNGDTAKHYFADHFFYVQDAAQTNIYERLLLTPAERAIVPEQCCAQITLGAIPAGQTFWCIGFHVENAMQFQSKITTMSFYAKASVATNLTHYIHVGYGTGGSADQDVEPIGTRTYAIGTGWSRYTCTFTNLDYAGKTFGTNSYLRVTFYPWKAASPYYTPVYGATLSVTGFKLENGSTATSYETPNPADDLRRCQRYYEKSFATDYKPGKMTSGGFENMEHITFVTTTDNIGNGVVYGLTRFKVTKMKSSPTCTVISYNGTNNAMSYFQSDFPPNSAAMYHPGENGFMMQNSSGINITNITSHGFFYNWTAESEF